MSLSMRFIIGRARSQILLLSLVIILISLVFWRPSNPSIGISKLGPPLRKAITAKKYQAPKCSLAPLPREVPRAKLKGLWQELSTLFSSHAPLLDTQSPGIPSNFDYSKFEPLQPNTATEASRIRSIHESLLEKIPPPLESTFDGRGIVMMAGGQRSEYAATAIGVIRILGSQLPIELWFVHKDAARKGWCQSLLSEGVGCRFLADYIYNASSPSVLPHEDQYKTAAILFSAFSEVIYLDSDSFPVIRPDDVFDAHQFKVTGSIVYPDFWSSSQGPWADYVVGLRAEASGPYIDYRTLDIAQMVWNKKVHWRTLVLATYYTHYTTFFQPLLSTAAPFARGFGACFSTALRVLQANHHLIPKGPDQISRCSDNGEPDGPGVVVLHAHPTTGKPVFMHTSIVRFGVRDLVCDATCIETSLDSKTHQCGRPTHRQRMIGTRVRTMGAIATRGDPLYDALKEGKKLLSWKQLERMGLGGFETNVWKVLERNACGGGAWTQEGLCNNVIEYIGKALDRFEPWRGSC